MNLNNYLEDVEPPDLPYRLWAVRGIFAVVLLVSTFVVLRFAWYNAGPIATILYGFLFLVGLTWLPVIIYFGAPSFPGTMRSIFGKGHWILAAVAYNVPFLVQHETGWQLHLGRENGDQYEVYINGDWHPIADGLGNMTVLGWRPFGILRWKDDKRTLVGVRADTRAEHERNETALSLPDGGDTGARAGYSEAAPPAVSGDDGRWLVDLKRAYSQGMRKIGDIDVIEKAEEVARRKQAGSGRMDGWQPIIGSLVGLVLGVATGYVLLGGV